MELINTFQNDLQTCDNLRPLVARYLVYGDCAELDSDKYFRLKEEVSNRFRVHQTNVLVVGSTKLGFSLSPDKLWKRFGPTSDCDVAIIDRDLYSSFWEAVLKFERTGGTWENKSAYRKYHSQGWIRPDLLPAELSQPPLRREWFEFFNNVSRTLSLRIAAGLYYSWEFFETYQEGSIRHAKEKMMLQMPVDSEIQATNG